MTGSKLRPVWKGACWLAAAVALAMLPATARADFKVSLTVAGSNIVVTDNLAGDLDPAAGSIFIAGTLNSVNYNIAVNSNKNEPSEPQAQIQDATVNIQNQSGVSRSIQIAITDTGFTKPGAAGTPARLQSQLGISSIGGENSPLTGTFQSYADNSNAEFGTEFSTPVQNMLFPLPPSEQLKEILFTRSGTYSLSSAFDITLPANQQLGAAFTGTTRVLAIPAPDNILLLASSTPLLGLCGWFLRRGLWRSSCRLNLEGMNSPFEFSPVDPSRSNDPRAFSVLRRQFGN